MQNKDKTENFRHHDEEEHTSQITESTHPSLNPPKPAATSLNLNSPAKTAIKDINAFTQKQVMKENSIKSDFTALGLDLNEPLHPYNELGRASSPSPSSSECGSTTGQEEISESMKKWIEMKQNGFVSIVKVKRPPLPRPKRQQSIKNKELNERIRVHHPAQLLSGLNPGIIKHVRNSKQVNSIIKAMLQNEMLEKHKPHHLRRSEEQYSDSVWKSKFNHEKYKALESDDDALTLKLSCSPTRSPDQEAITSLSVKAADFALQWLKLIQHDLSARRAAIKRSKNRVKNAVEVVLPYLFSRDLQPRQEIEPSLAPSFLTRCSQKEVFNVHLARWKAVFTQTEVYLSEEENQLETWLKQVEELNSQCQEGLKFVSTNGFLHLDAAKELRILKSPEAYERELAVRAAAASIYSTCDMTMNAKNVPYFKNKNRQI